MSESDVTIENTITPEIFALAIRGEVYRVIYDQKISYKVTGADKGRLEEAMKLGFLVSRRSDRTLRSAMFMWSEMERAPYILIEQRGTTGKVSIDFIALQVKLNEEGKRRLRDILISFSIRNPLIGATFTHTPALPLDEARRFAEAAVQVSKDPSCLFTNEEWARSGNARG